MPAHFPRLVDRWSGIVPRLWIAIKLRRNCPVTIWKPGVELNRVELTNVCVWRCAYVPDTRSRIMPANDPRAWRTGFSACLQTCSPRGFALSCSTKASPGHVTVRGPSRATDGRVRIGHRRCEYRKRCIPLCAADRCGRVCVGYPDPGRLMQNIQRERQNRHERCFRLR